MAEVTEKPKKENRPKDVGGPVAPRRASVQVKVFFGQIINACLKGNNQWNARRELTDKLAAKVGAGPSQLAVYDAEQDGTRTVLTITVTAGGQAALQKVLTDLRKLVNDPE